MVQHLTVNRLMLHISVLFAFNTAFIIFWITWNSLNRNSASDQGINECSLYYSKPNLFSGSIYLLFCSSIFARFVFAAIKSSMCWKKKELWLKKWPGKIADFIGPWLFVSKGIRSEESKLCGHAFVWQALFVFTTRNIV